MIDMCGSMDVCGRWIVVKTTRPKCRNWPRRQVVYHWDQWCTSSQENSGTSIPIGIVLNVSMSEHHRRPISSKRRGPIRSGRLPLWSLDGGGRVSPLTRRTSPRSPLVVRHDPLTATRQILHQPSSHSASPRINEGWEDWEIGSEIGTNVWRTHGVGAKISVALSMWAFGLVGPMNGMIPDSVI